MVKEGDLLRIILLVIVLGLCFFLVYRIHFAYPYNFIEPESAKFVTPEKYPFPLHTDEWAHIAMGLAIAEEKKLNFNPYLGTPSQDREIGFHVILADFFLFTRINPVLAYQFFAPIMLAINAFFLFFLVYKLTKNYWIGLFSIFFFASIKSNMNIMGNWFFTPATFTLFLIFIYLYFFTKAFDSKSKAWVFFALSLLIFLITAFIYPLAAVLLALISAVYAFTRTDFIRKNWKYSVFFGIIAIIIAALFIKLYFWNGSVSATLQKFLGELVFKKGWTALEHTYSLLSFYGLVPLILAGVGIVYLLLKKKNWQKNWLFIIWPAILLLNLLLFVLFSFSLLFPYQMNFFYLLISFAPLSAMGLYWLCELIFTYSKKYVFKSKDFSIAAAVVLVILALLFTLGSYYQVSPKEFSLQKVITVPEYEALLWLKENYQSYNKVLAKPFLSTTVYPVSRNRVVGMMPSSLEGGAYGRIYDFFNGNCALKQRLLSEENVTFVLSSEEVNCAFLGRIYYKDGVTIYKAG